MIEGLLPIAASEHAPLLDSVLLSVHVHMAVQAVAWGMFFVFCLVRFRRRANPVVSHRRIRPFAAVAAIGAVVVGDAVILAWLALPAWASRTSPPPGGTDALEVRVVAEQFAWNVHYPGPDGRFGATSAALISPSNPLGIDRADAGARDDIGVVNVLTVPVGRTIVIHLTARDVIHAFTLNEMRVKQDATPGQTVRTWFTPTRTGRWEIACSELCGLGHYRMRGEYAVVTEDEWQVWLKQELKLLAAPR